MVLAGGARAQGDGILTKGVVDFHNHIGKGPDASQTADELVRDMDEFGIKQAVVFPINEQSKGNGYRPVHERIAGEMKRFPGRLTGFVRLCCSRRRESEAELARIDEYGFKGIKLHPLSDGFTPRMATFALEAAEALNVPVIIHTAHDRNCQPGDWDGPAGQFPGVTFIFAHCGRSRIEEAVEVAKRRPNVMFDTSVNIYFNVKYAADRLPASRFLFASDTPYSHRAMDFLKAKLIWSGEELEAVMSLNALKILEGARK
ncbi:MAG: amidohydrolase family protein [Candidatus Brocadiia bacterium]